MTKENIKTRIESAFNQAWYQDKTWVKGLIPFSWLFGALSKKRKEQQISARTSQLNVPVVVIGNISIGGTGKTPLIIHLCRQLQQHGVQAGVISRGYGGKLPFDMSYPHVVTQQDSASVVGDEPKLIQQQTQAPVVVSPNRTEAAQCLVENFAVDVILSDDGLQHYKLDRDYEVVVIDGQRGFGNMALLPSGPLREPLSRLNMIDTLLVNGNFEQQINLPEVKALDPKVQQQLEQNQFQLQPDYWECLATGEQIRIADFDQYLTDKQVNAFAGIGNPKRFFDTLKSMGLTATEYSLSDHQAIEEIALKTASAGSSQHMLLMTSKDAVKCQHIIQTNQWHNCWALHMKVSFPSATEKQLLDNILQCINTRKQSNVI